MWFLVAFGTRGICATQATRLIDQSWPTMPASV
jgi:hypothetical protein